MRFLYGSWKGFLVIFLLLFLLIGISAVSYTATFCLFLGILSAWLIKTALLQSRNYVRKVLKYIFIGLIFLFFVFHLLFILDKPLLIPLPPLPIQEYEISVKPISLQMQSFLIEKKILVDTKEFRKLIKRSLQNEPKENADKIEGRVANIKSFATLEEQVDGISQGLILREVTISMLHLTENLEQQLKNQLNMQDFSFAGISCEIEKCSKSIINLIDFPQGAFYQAKEPINLKRSAYLNTETLRWSSRNPGEIKFAYITPPYNNFEKLIKLFSWFNSAEKYLIVLLGASLAFIFMPRVEKFLRGIKSTVNFQTIAILRSQLMSGDRHINTGGGNYIESNSGTYIHGDYITMSQDLVHAASQIQDLIEQLQKQGVAVDVAQEQVARDIATQAQTDSTVKDKLLKWGQSLGEATVSDVVKGAVKLAIRSAGIPLP